MITLELHNNLYFNVLHASKYEIKVLNMSLRRRQDGFMFSPLFKAKKWDGYDEFVKSFAIKGSIDKAYRIGIGLIKETIAALKENNIQFAVLGLENFIDPDVTPEKINNFMDILLDGVLLDDGTQLVPREYQFEGIYRALKYKFCTQELATSAGKTIIFFVYAAYLKYKKRITKQSKMLIIVPKIGLLNQTYDAFVTEYNTGLVPMNVMRVGDKFKFKQETFDDCDVLISTYQSLKNLPKEIFKEFGVLGIDEAHTSKGRTISDIIKESTNVKYKFGLSGTININKKFSTLFKIQEYIGSLRLIVKSSFLQSEGFSPNIHIKVLRLQHQTNQFLNNYKKLKDEYTDTGCPPGFANAKEFGKAMFESEKQYLYSSERRLEVISNLVKKLPGNTLILFNNVKDGYGQVIQNRLLEWNDEVHYIDGSIKIKNRESFQRTLEANEGVVIVASYGTFSTGLNLKRLHNIIFAESVKSEITVRQSIGRGMRLYANKNIVKIFDLVDMFPGMDNNYMRMHGNERVKIYKEQSFKYSLIDVPL